jgi:DNA-binding beta-propeller fold protein YncE
MGHENFFHSRVYPWDPKGGNMTILVRFGRYLLAAVLFLTCLQIARAQTQLATVQLNPYPQAISYNPVTNKIYVVDEPTSEVAEIDGISFQATFISLGPTSQQALNAAIRINPNTNTIYVTNVVDNNIAIVSGATHAVSFVAAGVNPVANGNQSGHQQTLRCKFRG